jgi:hypothetical protein
MGVGAKWGDWGRLWKLGDIAEIPASARSGVKDRPSESERLFSRSGMAVEEARLID